MREPNKDKDVNNVTQTFRFDTIKAKALSYSAFMKFTHFLGLKLTKTSPCDLLISHRTKKVIQKGGLQGHQSFFKKTKKNLLY